QRDKEKTNLIAKMDDDIKEIKQLSANASSVENLNKLEKMAKPSNTSDSTFNSNACKPIHLSTTSTGLVTPPEQVVEESIPKESSAESAIPCESFGNKKDTPPQKIPYNQKVEQDLICELLEFIKCHNSTSLPNSISSKHIPDIPVNADLTPGSVLHLAHLFDKAEKTGRKEKLRWYYY
ncbi:15070_t:CDS:2, partial [Rhizophagus irregularis]